MEPGILFKLLHVFAAFWLVVGVVGRNVTSQQALRATEMVSVNTLLRLNGIFDRSMVIPGSMVVLLLGLITAWLEGWPILGFITGGAVNWVLASLVIYLSVLGLVPLVFVPRGRVFEEALADANQQGKVTPRLMAAFTDPVTRAAHYYELGATAIVIVLMVTKPF